jgi:hypothetical protein
MRRAAKPNSSIFLFHSKHFPSDLKRNFISQKHSCTDNCLVVPAVETIPMKCSSYRNILTILFLTQEHIAFILYIP